MFTMFAVWSVKFYSKIYITKDYNRWYCVSVIMLGTQKKPLLPNFLHMQSVHFPGIRLALHWEQLIFSAVATMKNWVFVWKFQLTKKTTSLGGEFKSNNLPRNISGKLRQNIDKVRFYCHSLWTDCHGNRNGNMPLWAMSVVIRVTVPQKATGPKAERPTLFHTVRLNSWDLMLH